MIELFDINKIGMLIMNDECTKFLVCQKDKKDVTDDYIMPGGHLAQQNVLNCLEKEIREELSCQIDRSSIEYIDEFVDEASGIPGILVSIKLYKGELIGLPKPSSEIKNIYRIGKNDISNKKVSPIIRNKIIPYIIERGILK